MEYRERPFLPLMAQLVMDETGPGLFKRQPGDALWESGIMSLIKGDGEISGFSKWREDETRSL